MNFVEVIFIAFGLAMDAFAVSVASGVTIKDLKVNHALKIAIFFGGFQALMPVVGWFSGLSLRNFISGIDHWVVFGLLSFIGAKMIYEAAKMGPRKKNNPLNIYALLILSIATSIDALAVGITFAFLNISIIIPIIIIGAVTFVLSFLGVFIGNKIGHFFERKIETAGGFLLVGIGIKILFEHLMR